MVPRGAFGWCLGCGKVCHCAGALRAAGLWRQRAWHSLVGRARGQGSCLVGRVGHPLVRRLWHGPALGSHVPLPARHAGRGRRRGLPDVERLGSVVPAPLQARLFHDHWAQGWQLRHPGKALAARHGAMHALGRGHCGRGAPTLPGLPCSAARRQQGLGLRRGAGGGQEVQGRFQSHEDLDHRLHGKARIPRRLPARIVAECCIRHVRDVLRLRSDALLDLLHRHMLRQGHCQGEPPGRVLCCPLRIGFLPDHAVRVGQLQRGIAESGRAGLPAETPRGEGTPEARATVRAAVAVPTREAV
mmetsp:Transcript_80957/g.262224  ORF Transcript_80957/g.262224 Transcript_80957/m.262224 type:complete len:301 (-) Transcript_80957:825-1727(-)